RSIAYGIAEAMHREGASLAFTYFGDKFKDRVTTMAAQWNSNIIIPCDLGSDEQVNTVFTELAKHWDGLDGVVHSAAFAPAEQLEGDYVESVNREGFKIAHDVSSYSFVALAKAGLPLLTKQPSSLLTLSYLGAERTFPNYNVMGLAKASLEANVRYMAQSLGPKNIRVNAISAGPIRTLAASGIKNFRKMLDYNERVTPMRRNVTIEEVGNTAAFLCSDMASGITGEVIHVDSGFHLIGMSESEFS
ncbi:MAG: enoyl-ACP reductase, partial [Proteobacteria bacterium]|nr:enoyl-ACP reductase [Pseudomonadota bacterium]